jgi:UDP-N-acetylglucosamine--N-acetylmuramyl-(pentapeptide) pyrophosphoryl-undecaprenol N-acetylglucosamine transferase
VVTGNPVRAAVLGASAAEGRRRFAPEPELPFLLVTGGGTGALALNRIVAAAAPRLVDFAQVLHLTGRGRGVPAPIDSPRYRQVEFLVAEFPDALAAADLVVARAGLSTFAELAALARPAILVPMPDSHQEENAVTFAAAGAARVIAQRDLRPERLVAEVRALLADPAERRRLGEAAARLLPRDAAERVAQEVLALARR